MEYHNASLQQPHSRIDLMCILDRGAFVNYTTDDKKFASLPSFNTIPFYVDTQDSLLLFYTLVASVLNQARMPNFRFLDYMGSIEWSTARSSVG